MLKQKTIEFKKVVRNNATKKGINYNQGILQQVIAYLRSCKKKDQIANIDGVERKINPMDVTISFNSDNNIVLKCNSTELIFK